MHRPVCQPKAAATAYEVASHGVIALRGRLNVRCRGYRWIDGVGAFGMLRVDEEAEDPVAVIAEDQHVLHIAAN